MVLKSKPLSAYDLSFQQLPCLTAAPPALPLLLLDHPAPEVLRRMLPDFESVSFGSTLHLPLPAVSAQSAPLRHAIHTRSKAPHGRSSRTNLPRLLYGIFFPRAQRFKGQVPPLNDDYGGVSMSAPGPRARDFNRQ